ncbi:hypothetical protein D3C81_528380 [compost metagenome]
MAGAAVAANADIAGLWRRCEIEIHPFVGNGRGGEGEVPETLDGPGDVFQQCRARALHIPGHADCSQAIDIAFPVGKTLRVQRHVGAAVDESLV